MSSNGIHSYYYYLMSYWVMKKSQLVSLELFKFPNTQRSSVFVGGEYFGATQL